MIEVIFEGGKFLVKGTFSLGIVGVFENKDFYDTNIQIEATLDEILEERKKDSFHYHPMIPYLKGNDGNTIACGLAAYYNQKEKEAQQNIKQINDCILCHLFEQLQNCEYPFWDIEGAVISTDLDEQTINSIYDIEENISEWSFEYFEEKPNNGTVSKMDVEKELRKIFPMFNFDGLYQSIIPEGLVFDGKFIEVQFSDGWGQELLCGAYDRFDENFTSCEWNNF